MDGDDVGMVETRQGARFAIESFGKARVVRSFRREDFQCDQTIQARLSRLVYGAHAAHADEVEYLKLREQSRYVVQRQWRESSEPHGWTGRRAGSTLLQLALRAW